MLITLHFPALDRNALPAEVPLADPVPTVMASAVSVSIECFLLRAGQWLSDGS